MKIGLWHCIPDTKYWRDGLWAAIQLLKEKYEIVEFEHGDIDLVECSSENELLTRVKGFGGKIIWFHAGGYPKNNNVDYTVVLADQLKRGFEKIGVKAITINGTNTALFRPLGLEKKWDVIFPAAYAVWKRHSLLIDWVRAENKPLKVLVVGHKQKVETECYEICEKEGFDVLDQVTPEELAVLYNQSKQCWIPTEVIGGSEKTVLEALACGLKVRVAEDNERLQEILIQPCYSHYYYAQKIESLISSLI